MLTHTRNTEQYFLFRSGRAGKIEQWRDNGDGTITRIDDTLTLTRTQYRAQFNTRPLPRRFEHDPRVNHAA